MSRVAPLLLAALSACAGFSEDGGRSPKPQTDTSAMCHRDADLDGFGDPDVPTDDCGVAAVPDASDCDDDDGAAHPGAPEVCDGADNDCDGRVDDADDDLADGLPFWTDADADGYGAPPIVAACAARAGLALRDGDCADDDATVHPAAVEACDGVDRDCDGTAPTETGSSAACAASTCADVLAADSTTGDGAYWLALPSGATAAVWCDMTTEGGGWTLGFLRNSVSTGSQGDFGAGDVAVADLGVSPAAASASAAASLAWTDLDALPWTELRLAAYASGVETYTSRAIPRTALRIPFGSDGYFLYGGDTGYYWCGGSASYTDEGVGAVDNPPDAPLDCKGHGSLGSGWDFSESNTANAGLTLCGADASAWIASTWGGGWIAYGTTGGAQVIWIR